MGHYFLNTQYMFDLPGMILFQIKRFKYYLNIHLIVVGGNLSKETSNPPFLGAKLLYVH